MLKRISGILGLLLLACTVAYAPSAYAALDGVVLTHIQTGVTGRAGQEFIGLYNSSDEAIDVTDWCLKNKSGVGFACLSDPDGLIQYILPSRASALIASDIFMMDQANPPSASWVYESGSSSSGRLVGSADTITLVDAQGQVVDIFAWTSSVSSGMLFQRKYTVDPLTYLDTDHASDWEVKPRDVVPVDGIERIVIVPDNHCTMNCPTPPMHPMITELLPNADGADEGKEFIELYNPNEHPLSLDGYMLWVGMEPKSPLALPAGLTIEPLGFIAITQMHVSFTLGNSAGKVALKTADGELVSETTAYEAAPEDETWAFIDGEWSFTNQATPGVMNRPKLTISEAENDSSDPVTEPVNVKPCAANQYRHPETNRCRLLVASATAPAACKPNQYRSTETNRCRNIVMPSSPTPCKEGQERNPETGRCRNIKQMTKAEYGVLAATTESKPDQWYVIGAVGLLLVLLVGYGVWEWRHEIGKVWHKGLRFIHSRK